MTFASRQSAHARPGETEVFKGESSQSLTSGSRYGGYGETWVSARKAVKKQSGLEKGKLRCLQE